MTDDFEEKAVLLLYHKQSTSARTLFFQKSEQQLCIFDPFPELATVYDSSPENIPIVIHPSSILSDAYSWLKLEPDQIELDEDFCEYVDIPNGIVTVFMAHFTSIDPPQADANRVNAKFISLTEARSLSVVERELLKRAYTYILG